MGKVKKELPRLGSCRANGFSACMWDFSIDLSSGREETGDTFLLVAA